MVDFRQAMSRRIAVGLLMAATAAAGPFAFAQLREPTGPQPELSKESLVIVTREGQRHPFNVEMAISPEQQTIGLMFRRDIPADGGMLFRLGRAAAVRHVDAQHHKLA